MNLKINKMLDSKSKTLNKIGYILYDNDAGEKGLSLEKTDELASLLLDMCSDEEDFEEELESEKERSYGEGHDSGYDEGYDSGRYDGFEKGEKEGLEKGKELGYDEGYKAAMEIVHQNIKKEETEPVVFLPTSDPSERKYMNMYSPPGTRVRFMNKGGYEIQPRLAIKAGLIEEEVYTVAYVDVGGWTSYVYLKEFPNEGFNTAMFDQVEEDEV